jgi:predicted nucleic acid-binding protein
MLSVIDCYDSASMRVIGTIGALYPAKDRWNYHMQQYAKLSEEQKAAIAVFLQALPDLVELDDDDAKRVARSLKNYWAQFLPRKEIHVGS